MTHKEEIKYWAEHPDGTQVWVKWLNHQKWEISSTPKWYKDYYYIVDDEWAELRKAQTDGKQLQRFSKDKIWEDGYILDYEQMEFYNPCDWRIKLKKPIYEWQWIYVDIDKCYHFTPHCVTREEAIAWAGITDYVQKYAPSKRRRND